MLSNLWYKKGTFNVLGHTNLMRIEYYNHKEINFENMQHNSTISNGALKPEKNSPTNKMKLF